MKNAELTVTNLSWKVKDKTVLNQVNLSIDKGETIGIVGPNGAGKTSLLKCIFQEYKDYQGKVALNGHDIKQQKPKSIAQTIAVVNQHYDATFDLTVDEVVHMGLIPHKSMFEQDNSEDIKNIERALNIVNLDDKRQQMFTTLSGGEQQRCLIARAIVQDPQLLIMDEPTNHLDVYYQHQIFEIVKGLNVSLLMSIHDLNLAAQYCDKILLLNQGVVEAFDTPEVVLSEKRLSNVFCLPCHVDKNPFNGKPRVTFSSKANIKSQPLAIKAST